MSVCVEREVDEELELDLRQCAVRHFTTFTFDFSFAGFFEVKGMLHCWRT